MATYIIIIPIQLTDSINGSLDVCSPYDYILGRLLCKSKHGILRSKSSDDTKSVFGYNLRHPIH